jgi:hypothetical protein
MSACRNTAALVLLAAEAIDDGTFVGTMVALMKADVPARTRLKFYDIFECDLASSDHDLWASAAATRAWRVTALCFLAARIEQHDW